MRTAKTSSMAEDVARLYQALALSMKRIRTVAERLKKDTLDAQVKAQMEAIISRSVLGQKRPATKPPKTQPAEGNTRLRRVDRVLAALTDGQLNLVLGLARSLARDIPKGQRSPKGPAPVDEKPRPTDGSLPANPLHHPSTRKD